jgi:hypothetical protein
MAYPLGLLPNVVQLYNPWPCNSELIQVDIQVSPPDVREHARILCECEEGGASLLLNTLEKGTKVLKKS